jgi:hypothetical protein
MEKYKKFLWYITVPFALFCMEMLVKLFCFQNFSWRAIVYTGLFSISVGLGIAFLCSGFSKKTNAILTRILFGFFFLLFSAQIVYFSIFKTFGTLYSLGVGAGAVTQFWSSTVVGIRSSLLPLFLLLIVYGVLWVASIKIAPEKRKKTKVVAGIAVGLLIPHLVALMFIVNDASGILPVRYIYRESFIPTLSVQQFGLVTTLRLDAQALVLGGPLGTLGILGGVQAEPLPEVEKDPPEPEIPKYAYNVMEIDFDGMIEASADPTLKDMHRYFKEAEPTMQNKYTGLFEGKNLIWIVGEAFSTLALDETVTPTLYRLAQEGFVFENFYNPIWSVSTSDGEYVTLTGLLPKSGVWSFKESAKNFMPYGFGNLMKPFGYTAKAYHNHYYSYYDRHRSHPNLGYEYKGLGNGLQVKETWPESDLEMMELTLPKDMTQTPFHTYYMAVSGHLNYTFSGNYIASKNRKLVEHLTYSEGPRAYLACNAELDKAVAYLLEQLDAADLLEDTVIVISGDHYPYGLTLEEMEELAGTPLEERFEKYKSTLILWSGALKEPIPVSKVCSSLDVMPTLANLFGLPYDSRLVTGQDILSDTPGLVEFGDRSFITDLGRYDSKINQFIPNPGIAVDEEYPKRILKKVNDSFAYAAKMLERDYYRIVWEANE